MKHFRILTAWICLLALVAALFSGCAGAGIPQDEETSLNPNSETEEPTGDEDSGEETDSETESVSEVETEEPDPVQTPVWNPERLLNRPIPDYCTQAENQALYDTGIRSSGNSLPEVHGRYLQIIDQDLNPADGPSDTDAEYSVRVYEIKTGEEVGTLSGRFFRLMGGLDSGGIWWVALDGSLNLCDLSGTVTVTLELGDLTEAIRSYQYAFFDVTSDGNFCVAHVSGDNFVTVFDLRNGERTEVVLDPADSLSILSDKSKLVLGSWPEVTYVFDPDTVSFRKLDYPCWELIWTDGNHVLLNHNMHAVFYQPDGTVTDTQIGCYPTAFQDGILFADTWENERTIYRFFDLTQGVCLGGLEFSEFVNPVPFFSSEGDMVFCLYQPGDDHRTFSEILYYLVDLSALSGGYSCETVSYQEGRLNELIDARINELTLKTGIQIRYGSEGNDFQITSYIGRAALSEIDNYNAVKAVAEVLERYPDGMLQEAAESYKGILIYLCSGLYGMGEGSISTAGGVTSEEDGYIIIALDISSPSQDHFLNDIPHELSHVFDRRIRSVRPDYDDEWADLSPSGAYTYSYSNYEDNLLYTPYDSSYGVWFVDGYSRTYPTEDRARIMENLFNTSEENADKSIFAENQNIKEKAIQYCSILRECFSSCDSEDLLPWEIGLAQLGYQP